MDGIPRAFEPIDDDSASSQRTRSRDSLFLIAPMRIGDADEAQDVRVRNLSEGGLMVEMTRPLPIGTAVVLEVRGIGPVRGQVAWCAEGRAGIALDEAINPRMARKPVAPARKR